MTMLGIDDWQCPCGCVNYDFRKRCRFCDETREKAEAFRELTKRIAQKTQEIAATGLCQWGYRTAEEIAALPDDE